MEVILLDDITNLGREGDVVSVADGHARNYLIPQKLVVKATAGNLKQLEHRRRAIEDREGQKRTQALELAEELKDKSIIVRASVGEGGRLHGEVTAHNIAEAVAEQHGVEISRHDVDIPTPIREKGDYLISA
ncbi:MAG: 50S ribosomal protein L9, partial [Armatimonadetes bacterium]|nr:50S ribosomal protein L9 [Armatimonadota bacterium]